jgi:hypothetical protein
MLDRLRTVIAKFMVKYLPRPHPLLVTAWHWLAAQTDDIEEKKRCLWAILDLDPDNTRALLGLLAFVLEEADD